MAWLSFHIFHNANVLVKVVLMLINFLCLFFSQRIEDSVQRSSTKAFE